MTDEKKLDPERLEIAADVMKALVRMLKGEQDACLHCSAKIGQLYQNGDCVYADPCGCRQYQGTLPNNI
jgi:hypothetical protein